jgi:hypothetical protein
LNNPIYIWSFSKVFSQTLKCLRDVTAFANAGNQGEFMRVLDRQSPLPENNNPVHMKHLPEASSRQFWHSDESPCPDNVIPLR